MLSEAIKPSQQAKRKAFSKYKIEGWENSKLTGIFYSIQRRLGLIDEVIEELVGVSSLVLDRSACPLIVCRVLISYRVGFPPPIFIGGLSGGTGTPHIFKAFKRIFQLPTTSRSASNPHFKHFKTLCPFGLNFPPHTGHREEVKAGLTKTTLTFFF